MQEVVYQEAFNLLKPEACIFVVSVDQLGKPNVMTAGWSMKCSHEPPLFAIAISKTGYTHKLIHENKQFVVAVPDKKMEKYLTVFGGAHGDKADKLTESGVETEKAKHVRCPLLKHATINLECELYKEVEAGDHVLFIGKILAAHMNPHQKILFSMHGSQGKRSYEEF